jgi:hypothetical protein
MKTLLGIGLLACLLTPGLATAQNAFDGTWKLNLNPAEPPKKPDVFLLQDGMYQCKTCVPPIDIKADGQDQKVSGDPYHDTVSIRVVDDHTMEETDKKDGKIVTTTKVTVSPMATRRHLNLATAAPPTPTQSRARAKLREWLKVPPGRTQFPALGSSARWRISQRTRS